ncbi:hypothetical protein BC830DRAFT_1168281 [Chytriomyces sp. MP71]|nr:hypothetical protein BC830DRAFT_1168281 [Chytriomyces sp. MP71]
MEAGSSQTPLHIISTFPTETGSRNITRSPCEICLAPFDADSTTRTIPSCAHTFHQPCIDRWLLMHVNTCPTCKVPAFHRVERMGEEIAMGPGILEEASFIPAPTSSGVAWMDAAAQRRRGKGGKPSSKNSPKSELGMDSNDGRGMGAMVIVGSRSFPGGPTNADKVTPPMPLASSLGSVSGSERHSVMHPREKIHQGRSTVGGTSPPKPTRLPPLFTQQQQQMQKTKSQIHLANSITQHHQASPTVAFGSTLSTASLTQAHALTLRSGTQNHPKEFPTPKLLFEDLLVSQSLSKLSLSQNLVAVAAEADTLPASGDQIPGFADSEISVPSRTVSLVHGSSSVPAPIAKRSPPQAVPHLHPSLPGPFFKPSLAKRRYLPHTSLSAIENPPLNVNALIECVTYNGSTTNLGVLEMGTGATLYVRDSGGKGSPMKGGSVLPKIPIQNVRRRQK